jgi:hypothetical protein
MRYLGLTPVLLLAAVLAQPVVAQEVSAPSAAVFTEREAGRTAMDKAVELANAGEKRGPDSEAATRAMSHFHAAAVAAGAIRRGAYWSGLSEDELTAAALAARAPLTRNDRIREHLCRAT